MLIVALLSTGVLAQDTKLVLRDGTPIPIRTTENLSSHDAVTGGTIDFEVMEDIYVNDVLVVKKGSPAIGTITDAQHKKTMGRQGKLDITIDYVRLLNGEKAQLRGVKQGSGGGHTGAMVGAMVVTSLVVWPAAPLFLFMHGKDINIAKGTPITGYVDGDFTIGQAKARAITVLQPENAVEPAPVVALTTPVVQLVQPAPIQPAPPAYNVKAETPNPIAETPADANWWVNTKDLEAAAKRSKQHADCLNLAASNPSITCK